MFPISCDIILSSYINIELIPLDRCRYTKLSSVVCRLFCCVAFNLM